MRACWLTQYEYLGKSELQLRELAQNIRAGEMNTVYFVVYAGGGQTFWPSKAYLEAGGSWQSPGFDNLRALTRLFREEGLRVGAWFEYGLALSDVNHPLAVAHPDWLARDIGGEATTGENGGFVFLSPGHDDAVELMVDMVTEMAASYAFDDIQLDRFRWGRKSTGREYGYEAATAAKYQALYGVPPPANKNDAQWVAFRESLVNDLVRACHDAIKATNPMVVVSSAPTGSYGITQHMQRWSSWVEGGYMDLVMPQMYMTSLPAFRNEFDFQLSQAGAHADKLGVGYRASESNDWALVEDQLEYARANGVPHGMLWVYHRYTSSVAIQDEIDNLPRPGGVWEVPAVNPFVQGHNQRFFVDDGDGSPNYRETGPGWIDSAQPDYFSFGSRVVPGGPLATAQFWADIPEVGVYEVFAWYTASSNRNPAARYTVLHPGGAATVELDQRTGGGRWVSLGSYLFPAGGASPRVTVSNVGTDAGTYTSSDAVLLVLRGAAQSYCTGKVNSLGCLPSTTSEGWPSAASSTGFVVRAAPVKNQKAGLLLYGTSGRAATPFQGGVLCVAAPIKRAPAVSSGGDAPPLVNCTGVYSIDMNAFAAGALGGNPLPELLQPGTLVYGQWWGRDTPGNATLSNGIEYGVAP